MVDDAVRGAPCVITRHGRREAVVIAYEEWEKLSRVLSFGRLLMAAPLEAGDLPKRNRKSVAICVTLRHWAFARMTRLKHCRKG